MNDVKHMPLSLYSVLQNFMVSHCHNFWTWRIFDCSIPWPPKCKL